jgi:hypothetical protein
MGLTLHVPPGPWLGNEREKRTTLFRLGELAAGDDGWLWVIDADETVTVGPTRTDLDDLDASEFDVAEVMFWTGVESEHVDTTQHPERRLFRSGLGSRWARRTMTTGLRMAGCCVARASRSLPWTFWGPDGASACRSQR